MAFAACNVALRAFTRDRALIGWPHGASDPTIVTNSVEIAYEMIGRPVQQVFLAGGRINSDHHAAFDPGALAYARGFVPDLAVLSIGAIEADRGFLDLDADEAMFERALLGRARRVMVIADATKCGRHGAFHVADFAAVDALVTDVAPPAAAAVMTIVAADAQSSESDDPPSA